MKHFIGIDLGTTNSAISSYDGASEPRVWKSPEQNDVTPSAIYWDKRGGKYVGKRAYDMAPFYPDNSAMLFKRFMGTGTPMKMPAVNLTKTPEECSAEVLKALFGYLPEEIRNAPETGTVITVPAAFNQMQKDATIQAAEMAGIGKVALMQEPVAAVMAVVRAWSKLPERGADGVFLIYDMGGGTFDAAIAENIGGHVNLLAHGGVAMCGGRDFDRALVDSVVFPWLKENFSLPDDVRVNPAFKTLASVAVWATERAKIELSTREDVTIVLSEAETRVRDLAGNDIYLEVPLTRAVYDKLIADKVSESIDAARETIGKAGMTPNDIRRLVFVGGPTNYKPLRDRVLFELGLEGGLDVNPMTAVAEGACVFAEAIDWSAESRTRKSAKGRVSLDKLSISFDYIARTPNDKAKVTAKLAGQDTAGFEFQIDSFDTGWSSGRLPLANGTVVTLSLSKMGDNTFKVLVFDSFGAPIVFSADRIVITRTAATIDAIPASHPVALEVLEKLGGRPVLQHLLRDGDSLPKKVTVTVVAGETIKAGSADSLKFRLWQGEIENPVHDNRFIGVFNVSGSDFDDGVIAAGAEMECEFDFRDGGDIHVAVSVPSIGETFHSSRNFYDGKGEGAAIDYSDESMSQVIADEAEVLMHRLDKLSEVVDDPDLEKARQKLNMAMSLDDESTTEDRQKANDEIQAARKLLARVGEAHRKEIRQVELDDAVGFFDSHLREHARPSETSSIERLTKAAQRSIDRNDGDFDDHLDALKKKSFEILARQDWFAVSQFKYLIRSSAMYTNKARFNELAQLGAQCMRSGDIDELRSIIGQLFAIRIAPIDEGEMREAINIIRG